MSMTQSNTQPQDQTTLLRLSKDRDWAFDAGGDNDDDNGDAADSKLRQSSSQPSRSSRAHLNHTDGPLQRPSADHLVRESDLEPSTSRHRHTTSLGVSHTHRTPTQSSRTTQDTPSMVEILLDPPSPEGRIRVYYEKNKGLAYVLLAQVFGVLMNVTTRLLEIEGNEGQGMHPFQILFVRMIITTTLCYLYMWWNETPQAPFGLREVRWLLVLRGVGGFFGVFGMYYSLLFLPLADATVITFISPTLSCFACAILLREPFTRMEQVGALVSFIGVTLIARPTTFFSHGGAIPPPADASLDAGAPMMNDQTDASDYASVTSAQRLGAVCVALVGVLGQAMAFTTMRWIGKRAHPLLSVTYFCAFCTIVSAIAMSLIPGIDFILPANAKEWSYLIFLGLCGFAMQFLLSAGLQHEKSSRATNMVYTQMLFALLFDKLVFGTNPTLLSFCGSMLILGSALYVATQKESLKQKAEAEKTRQAAAQATGRQVEMQTRQSNQMKDEERGLVQGMDMSNESEEKGAAKI